MSFLKKENMKIKKINVMKYYLPVSVLLMTSLCILTGFKVHRTEKIGRPVRVVSFCFRDQDFNKIIKLVEEEASKGTDIISLPETWRGQVNPETISGETITALSRIAKKYKTYILSPI